MRPAWLAWTLLLVMTLSEQPICAQQSDYAAARRQLVRDEIIGAGITDQRVIDVMRRTPRHEFVPPAYRQKSYFDISLPIGKQQTISSPFIVAYMTESLDPRETDKVLEIGTGSGYQAAVLSPLVAAVYTIEIVESLGRRASKTLHRLGYQNVHTRIGDGYLGWPEEAPFDKIIVTCSPEDVPQALIEQLADGGRMVIPVGLRYQQVLYLFTKQDGKLQRESLRPTLFVPMTGEAEGQRVTQPDPKNPSIANGSFEEASSGDHPFAGWYYQRQVERVEDQHAPNGKCYAHFFNETAGRTSRVLQGFAVDGKQVRQLSVSAQIRVQGVRPGPVPDRLPMIVISFYDAQRAPLSQQWLGPWPDDTEWRFVQKSIRVPTRANEAILRVGMFGATGDFWVDDVRLAPQS